MVHARITRQRSVPEAIFDALAEGGVRYVLGLSGGLTGRLWKALYEHPTIQAIQVREESVGTKMAEAYGRSTGQPIVVMGQGEWITGNAGAGYLEALLGASPMILLTEMTDGDTLSHHAPYQSGTGDYGTWDVRRSLSGSTKRVMVSYDGAQAVQHVQLALKHAMTGEPGPVAVVLHSSAVEGTVGPDSTPRIYGTEAYLPRPWQGMDEAALEQAAEALRGAERPVIIAGNGVRLSRAQDSLARLARAIDAPIATTASGKGVFSERDPLSIGPLGFSGWASANAVVGAADVVLAIGTKLAPHDTLDEHPALIDPARQVIIQVDVEPLNASWTFPVDHVLLADAGYAMDRLAESYASGGRKPGGNGLARAEEGRRAHPRAETNPTSDAPFAPQFIIQMIEEVVPEDTIITCDAGENRLFMMQWYRAGAGGDYLQPAGGGGMGYAVSSALGARLADPDRPVLAFCGDGGFGMSMHALMTAVQQKLPIAVVVMNNGCLGWTLHSQGDTPIVSDLGNFDHAAIGRSLGCQGVRVTDAEELRVALKMVADLTEPLVIDVPTSMATSFADVKQILG
ncbi:MAG: thiamine pyrophosphate-binding protein [Acidobacteria bacterium]|nr:thiamine pyrophosphate-binding protein [Acidobacteriota bacterium]